MSKQVKVSIVIPTYNVEKYIENALDSAIRQTLFDIEILCIDNHSEDGTWHILQLYEHKDNRIHVIRNTKNEGISFSRNMGIQHAKGKYLFFLDADDELVENAMEILYEEAENSKTDILYFGSRSQFENEDLKNEYIHEKQYSVKLSAGIMSGKSMFIVSQKELDLSHVLWRQFFRHEFLVENRLYFKNWIYHEDMPFSFMALLTASYVKCIPNLLYIRYRRQGSLTTDTSPIDSVKAKIKGYCDSLFFWRDQNYDDEALNDAILQYLTERYRALKVYAYYVNDNSQIKWDNFIEKHIYECMLMDSGIVTREIREIINRYGQVIIYGAGLLGGKVLEEIDRTKVLGFAVTDSEKNAKEKWGVSIKNIREYSPYKDDVIVVVAARKSYQEQIARVLISEGFLNYIMV